MNLLKTKEGILLLSAGILFIVTFVFAFILFPSAGTRSQRATPTPPILTKRQPLYGQFPKIESISPSEDTRLPAGVKQTFTIQFQTAPSGNSIQTTLMQKPFTDTRTSSVAFSKKYNERTKTLSITSDKPLDAETEYILTITDAKEMLLLAKFSTRGIDPTPMRDTNQALRAYLPHVAYNYRLEYNERLGTYIFEFRIDPYSSFDLQKQYAIAKKDAEDFIKLKGVNANLLPILWKGGQ